MRIATCVSILAAALLSACAAVSPPVEAPVAFAAGTSCNAAPDGARPQLVVGYGSLMEDESRRRTSPKAGAALPVEITGFRRGWYARGTGPGVSTTFLGVIPDEAARFNAVAYRVDIAELASTDRRESTYCRLPVPRDAIRAMAPGAAPQPDAQAWIYVSTAKVPPAADFPIVQSYVDVFVSGCLEQEEKFGLPGFAAECVRSTHGWSGHWVNDRIYPRRPFVYQPRARQIDQLIYTQLPGYAARISIEGSDRLR